MNESDRKRLAALARAYQDVSSGNPVICLGNATLYLSSAGAKAFDDPQKARQHLREWAIGSAAFAVAAAASSGGRTVVEVLNEIERLISEPGFDGSEGEFDSWLNSTFGILGGATVKSAESEAQRAAEEATLAAAIIVRMVEKFAST